MQHPVAPAHCRSLPPPVPPLLTRWCSNSLSKPPPAGAVSHGPTTCSATLRGAHTPRHVAAPAFRILSYNILADQYAGSDYAQNVLFNYCPKE